MRDWYLAQSTAVKLVTGAVIGAVLLVGLLFLYDWIGTSFLDSGGTVG